MVNAPMLIVPGHELVTSKYISPSFAVAFVAGIMLVTSTDMGHTCKVLASPVNMTGYYWHR